MLALKHQLIICTRDRVSEIKRAVLDMKNITGIDQVKLLIVENSENSENAKAIMRFAEEIYTFSEIEVIRSLPGLPTARNAAIAHARADLVTFIDDDAILSDEHFIEMDKLFASNREVIGAAPRVDVYSEQTKSPIFKIEPGSISGFGSTAWYTSSTPTAELFPTVAWLPGCAMTYRLSALENLAFNEELQTGPTGGYALGEDVDFSLRLSKKGKLICATNLIAKHQMSPMNRNSNSKLEAGIGTWQAYLVRNYTEVKFIKVLLFDFTYLMYLVTLFWSKNHRSKVRLAALRLRYFLTSSVIRNHRGSYEE
jgi:GT2 family glycosyltransferase